MACQRNGLVLCLVLSIAAPVRAQPGADAPPEAYTRSVAMGLEEFELGNYPEARARFLQAHRVLPSARTLRGLGKVEYELKRYGSAIEHLQQALDSQVRPLSESQRAETAELIQSARDYTATVTFDISPPDAHLRIDDEAVPSGKRTLVLDLGEHTLEVSADAYHTQRREITIKGGESRDIPIKLLPAHLQPGDTNGAPADALAASSEGVLDTWWFWTATGTAIVATALVAWAVTHPTERVGGDPETTLEPIGTVTLNARGSR